MEGHFSLDAGLGQGGGLADLDDGGNLSKLVTGVSDESTCPIF